MAREDRGRVNIRQGFSAGWDSGEVQARIQALGRIVNGVSRDRVLATHRYGARDPVKTPEEARKRLEAYFDGEELVVEKVSERPLYFEASIKHKDGRLVDRVIVDKRSGRIRSIL
jgi:hypothetical protein